MIAFDHIAIALERIASAAPLLGETLGGVVESGRPAGVFRWAAWRFPNGGCIEILEPMGPGGFLHRFLARRGPGIHHVTFRVPSLRKTCERAAAHGYGILGHDDSDPRWAEAFLHPKQALGTVVQLAEARASGGQTRARPHRTPAGQGIAILGLRTRARSRERAHTQWAQLLRAECTEGTEGELIYRWPGSSMRLAVEIDPTAEEGPMAVEFASDRPVTLPEESPPALRALFLQRPRSGG